MAANIEVNKDGRAAFVSGRDTPGWHGLGTTVEGLMTMDEVMDLSHLSGWNVRREPLVHRSGNKSLRFEDTTLNDDGVDTVATHYAVIRTNPFTGEPEALAVVGGRYREHQNEELFEFAENVISLGGAKWDTAGSLDSGRRVFGTMEIPSEFVLDPMGRGDTVRTYLGVASSHDGTMPITTFVTPVRVVCQNTLTMALRGNQRVYKVRHTERADARLAEARKSLNIAHGFFGEIEREAQELIQREITNKKFHEIVRTFVAVPDENTDDDGKVTNQAAVTRATNTVDFITDLYRESGTMDNVRGTAWGALNALTEYLDWFRPTRGDNKTENLLSAQMGIASSDTAKADALSIVKELTAA